MQVALKNEKINSRGGKLNNLTRSTESVRCWSGRDNIKVDEVKHSCIRWLHTQCYQNDIIPAVTAGLSITAGESCRWRRQTACRLHHFLSCRELQLHQWFYTLVKCQFPRTFKNSKKCKLTLKETHLWMSKTLKRGSTIFFCVRDTLGGVKHNVGHTNPYRRTDRNWHIWAHTVQHAKCTGGLNKRTDRRSLPTILTPFYVADNKF